MPRRDGTGPMGMGSLTGKGAGNCLGYAPNQFSYGNGMRNGGAGRGFRRMACCTGTLGNQQLDERTELNNQVSFLEKRLQSIKERLKGLDEMSAD